MDADLTPKNFILLLIRLNLDVIRVLYKVLIRCFASLFPEVFHGFLKITSQIHRCSFPVR